MAIDEQEINFDIRIPPKVKDKIIPKCKALPGGEGIVAFHTWNGGANLYVSSSGYVTPCCWMGTKLHLNHLHQNSGLDPKLHNLEHYNVQEIIDGPMWTWINNNMSNMDVCIDKCGTHTGGFDTWDVEYQQKPHSK
jgi:hypothetical protein